MNTRLVTWIVLAVLMAPVSPSTAQETVDATLQGRVTDLATGKAIPRAAVVVTSTTGAFAAETDDGGAYRIPFLKPGLHDVRVEAAGYGTVLQTDVRLSLGNRTELSFALAAGRTETITVSARAPLIDHASASTGANITEELSESLPLGRAFNSLFYLAPGVNSSRPGGAAPGTGEANPSISGATGLENNYLVDGINITGSGVGSLGSLDDRFGSLGTAVNVDFIQEVQVKTGGFEPEFGQSHGGVINAITKSGSNRVSGDVFDYFTSREGEGDRRFTPTTFGNLNVADEGVQSNDVGFTVGGPFVKDRLFWYAAYNHVETDTDVFAASTTGDPFYDEGNPARREFEADNWSAKLTWQVSSGHRLEASAFGDPSEMAFGPVRDASVLAGTGDTLSFSSLEFGSENFILRYTGVIHPRFQIEAIAAQANADFLELIPRENDQTQVLDFRTGFEPFGGLGFFGGSDHENNQLSLKLTQYLGSHELRYGLQYEDIAFFNISDATGDPWIIDPSRPPGFGGRETGRASPVGLFCVPGPDSGDPACPGSTSIMNAFIFSPDSFSGEFDGEYAALFVQDSWQITPHLSVKYGLRYEEQTIAGIGSGAVEHTWDDNLAPRLGFTWDPTHEGRGKLYGSLGRYYEKIPQFVGLGRLSGINLVNGAYYYFTPPTADVNGDGIINPVDGVAASLANPAPGLGPDFTLGTADDTSGFNGFILSAFVDPDSDPSYQDEIVLGYEHQLRPDLAIGGRILYREMREVLEQVSSAFASDVISGDATDVDFLGNPAPDLPAYRAPFTTDLGNSCTALNFPGYFAFDPGDFDGSGIIDGDDICRPASVESFGVDPERKYFALELTLDKRLSNRWQLLSSYRFSRLSGNYEGFYRSDFGLTQPNFGFSLKNPDEPLWLFNYESGVLPTDRTHILRFNGSYTLRIGSTVGVSWNVLSGAPLTALDPDPVVGFGATLVVEPRGNSGRTPTQNVVDVHFGHPFKLGRTDLKLFVDIFNLFDESTTTQYDYARGPGFSRNPDFGLAVGALPPRSARLGLKWSF